VPPEADINCRDCDVRFVPNSDIPGSLVRAIAVAVPDD
jgi:hypothetical protein